MLLVLAPVAVVALSSPPSCGAELDARHVAYKPRAHGAVEVSGPLGGVTYAVDRPLVIDCALAVALAEAGRYFRALGIDRVTAAPTADSLAIDLPAIGALRVDRDFELGLGDGVDCVGAPRTRAGRELALLACQLDRSRLFRAVLTPDDDAAHRDRFHLEAAPWPQLRRAAR